MAGYAKLFGSIVRSTVWVGTSPETKVVWVTLLALADRDGVVESSVPGLVVTSGVAREHVESAMASFMAPDPDSRTPDHGGRRIEKVDGGWRLLNYDKYAELQSASDVRGKAAERQRRSRDRKAANTGSTDECHADGHVTSRSVAENHILSDQDQDQHQQLEEGEGKPPALWFPQEQPDAITVTERPTDVWSAEDWLKKFKLAYDARGIQGATAFYGFTSDTKALATLSGELARLPLAVKISTQARSAQILARFFLPDPKKKERLYPFIFFVQEFGELRAATAKDIAAAPARQPEGATPYHLKPRNPPAPKVANGDT